VAPAAVWWVVRAVLEGLGQQRVADRRQARRTAPPTVIYRPAGRDHAPAALRHQLAPLCRLAASANGVPVDVAVQAGRTAATVAVAQAAGLVGLLSAALEHCSAVPATTPAAHCRQATAWWVGQPYQLTGPLGSAPPSLPLDVDRPTARLRTAVWVAAAADSQPAPRLAWRCGALARLALPGVVGWRVDASPPYLKTRRAQGDTGAGRCG